jgi:non-ribosomal peptide synthetase component F
MDSPGLFRELNGLALEHQTLISRFGRGPTIPVPHETVHGAFESIASAHPSTPAAKHHGKVITYAELDAAANRLANHLIDTGLAPKQRVCLVVQRSFEMLIGILAILKAGCQYVPIDGGITSDQALQHILRDTNSRFVLCLPKFEGKIKQIRESDVITVVLGADVEAFSSKVRPCVPVSASDGVYAIYTSGNFDRSMIPYGKLTTL